MDFLLHTVTTYPTIILTPHIAMTHIAYKGAQILEGLRPGDGGSRSLLETISA
jgi:hypothetical protein